MTTQHIAKTVSRIAEGKNPFVKRIMDRSLPLDNDLVQKIISHSQCHYAGRRPRRPGKKPSDMDLASYLLPLWQRQAVLELAEYQNRTPHKDAEGERRIGEVRYGQLMALSSHQEHLSFGVTINDVSVVKAKGNCDFIGRPRSFLLLDYDASWHAERGTVSWRSLPDEEQFNDFHGLGKKVQSTITTFVHQNRRESIFGAPYLLLKLLHLRLSDEISHYGRHSTLDTSAPYSASPTGDIQSALMPTFTVTLSGPKLVGEYVDTSSEYQRELWGWRSIVQWLMRIDELAFCLYGRETAYTAPWIKGLEWQKQASAHYVDVAAIELHPELKLTYRYGIRSKQVAAAKAAAPTDRHQGAGLSLLCCYYGIFCV